MQTNTSFDTTTDDAFSLGTLMFVLIVTQIAAYIVMAPYAF
jgi:hypothetical protein